MYTDKKIKKNTLRIGIDGRVLQEIKPSGIPHYALNIAREIIELDKQNEYIIFFNSFRKIEKEIPQIKGGNIEYKIYHFPNKLLEWLWKIVPYPKIDGLLDVDVFFSPHFIQIPLSKKVKKVVTIHDLSFLKNRKYFSWRKNFWHWQMNPKKICRHSEGIIAVSNSTKRDLVKIYNINKDKIKVIHNGQRDTVEDFSREDETETLKRMGLTNSSYLLFIATLEPRKNIDGIIEAYALIHNKYPSAKLVIAGKKGWLFESIFKKVKKNKLEKMVFFTGFVSEKEKEILLKNAAAFIFPSFCEGFGIPVIEAKRHRIPIITSSVSSLPEIIKDAAILVNPHNTHDIAQAIKIVLNNYNMRNILVSKSKKIDDFTWKDCAKETLDYLLC